MIEPKYSYKILNSITDQPEIGYDVQVSFRITEKCNLSCEYCLWHSEIEYSLENILQSIDNLFLHFQNCYIKNVLFYFHGGEPTRHKDFLYILEYIRIKEKESKRNVYIEFQTNLVFSKLKIDKLFELIDGLNVSVHLKELFKTNTFSIFNENLKYIREKNYKLLNLDIMLEYNIENMFKYLRRLLYIIKENKSQISEMVYNYIDKTNEKYKLIENEKKLYTKLYKKYNKSEQLYEIDDKQYSMNDLYFNKLNCSGMKCIAGYKQFIVNGNGDFFICNSSLTFFLNNINNEKPFMNIINDKYYLIKLKLFFMNKGSICKYNECIGDFYYGKGFK
jgi:MoaA/NifB/PqqE/SkfB family radical SAM enzyme